MANRPGAFGLTKEAQMAIDAKYDSEKEAEAMFWMEEVTGEKFYDQRGMAEVHKVLKDGRILCRVMNKLLPGAVKKINESSMAFKQMENINNFLVAAQSYGVQISDLFQTVDLYEKQNMHAVIMAIHSLGRKARSQGFSGPFLGPKEADKNERQFSDEQLKAGHTVIGLQMGTNKGANQSGMNFGKPRSILD